MFNGELLFISFTFSYISLILYLLYKQKRKKEKNIEEKKRIEERHKQFILYCKKRIRGE